MNMGNFEGRIWCYCDFGLDWNHKYRYHYYQYHSDNSRYLPIFKVEVHKHQNATAPLPRFGCILM